MTAQAKHIIKQQILDLTVPDLEDEAEVSEVFSEIYKQNIESIIEEVCAELIPTNRIIRIDSLTLDLGVISYNKATIDFPRAVKHSIKEEIYRQIRDQKVESWNTSPKLENPTEAFQTDKDAHSKIKNDQDEINPQLNTSQEHDEKVLLHYFETGLIPWYYDQGLQQLKLQFSSQLPLAIRIFKNHLQEESAIFRAIHFFELQTLEFMLLKNETKYQKKAWHDLEVIRKILDRLSKSSQIKVATTAKFIMDALAPKNKLYLINTYQLLAANTNTDFKISDLFKTWPDQYYRQIVWLFQKVDIKEIIEINSEDKVLLKEIMMEVKDLVTDQLIVEKSLRKYSTSRQQIEVGESLVVNNAGLILVWPYLQAFFTGLNLMHDHSFLDNEKTNRAVNLLHYLVFKSEGGDETMWLLNKLLCGLPESEFVPNDIALTPEEMAECDNLLTALIKNWPAIKKTSPDSLRISFLQRDGLLMRNENGWTLKVERQAFDILLDRLNWTISTVKLPWNNYMINTEW